MKHLKRAVIKEELIAVTDHFLEALVLSQMLYWAERVVDFDEMIIEENKRFTGEFGVKRVPLNGWIYKSADQLASEIMTRSSKQTILRHLSALITKGYLMQRRNPKKGYKWDRTYQYRVNFLRLMQALEARGYGLEGYPLLRGKLVSGQDAFERIGVEREREDQMGEVFWRAGLRVHNKDRGF